MKRNRIAIILVIVLGALSFWFTTHNTKTTLSKGLRDFAIKDTGAVTKIFIANKNNSTVTLEKQKPGVWKLNSKFFARADAINTLLETMKNIEVKSPVGKNAQENVIKDLAAGGIKIEAYEGDKLVKVYYVGGETMDLMGTNMLLVDPETMKNSSVPYITYIPGFDGYLTTRYSASEAEWRDKAIFRYIPPEIKSIKVEFPIHPGNGFEINNLPGARFEVRSLSDNMPLKNVDTMAVKQYVSYFQDIEYEAIEKLDKSFKDSIIASTPLNTIAITDMKGVTNSIKIFYKNGKPDKIDPVTNKPEVYDKDRIFALINNGADFVTIQYFVFGKLLQPVGYFTPKSIVKK